MPKISNEQFWKLYKNLPKELQDALFSEETGDNIASVCERNKIPDNVRGEIVDLVGVVLIGVLPAEDFQEELEKELKIKKEIAKKVAQEINRFIFYPVKPALEQLYTAKVNPEEERKEPAQSHPNIEAGKEKPTGPKKDDIYKESVE